MARYAETTSVPIAQSRVAIDDLLTSHGATAVGIISRSEVSEIVFEMGGYRVVFRISMPDFNDREFSHTPQRGTRRSPAEHRKAWDQACRQRWRALHRMIRAKLEAIESGLVSMEDEFLANIALPSGQILGEMVRPALQKALAENTLPQFAIGSGR